MKINLGKKEFPLVALVLIAIAIGSSLLATNYVTKAVVLINSDEQLRMSFDDDPNTLIEDDKYFAFRTSEGYHFDYFFRAIPEPTPLVHPLDRNLKTKEIKEEALYGQDSKQEEFIGAIKVGDAYYKFDWDRTANQYDGEDIRLVDNGRTAWIMSYYGPKFLTHLAIALVSVLLALALLSSYKKGYILSRNVTFIRVSAFAVGLAAMSIFVAKGLLLIGVFGEFGIGNMWADLLVGSIIPALLVLAAIIGLTHIVTQSMKKSIEMKEEIDGTV